jgi:hypothetical protein
VLSMADATTLPLDGERGGSDRAVERYFSHQV